MKATTSTIIHSTEGLAFSQNNHPAQYFERWFEIGGAKFARRLSVVTPLDRGRYAVGEDREVTLAHFEAWCERLNINLVREIYDAQD